MIISKKRTQTIFILKVFLNYSNWVAIPSAHLRHITSLLPLLPSGPGGVHKQSLRRHQWDHHYNLMHWAIEMKMVKHHTELFLIYPLKEILEWILNALSIEPKIWVVQLMHVYILVPHNIQDNSRLNAFMLRPADDHLIWNIKFKQFPSHRQYDKPD